MMKFRFVHIGAVGAAIACLAGSSVTSASAATDHMFALSHTSAAATGRDWYWSRGYAQNTLVQNGIGWDLPYGPHTVLAVNCTGLGHWIVSQETAMFRDFYCYVQARYFLAPRRTSPNGLCNTVCRYNIVFHVVGKREYRYTFGGWQLSSTWGWTTQHTADSLVNYGIRWAASFDHIFRSTCSGFGDSWVTNGYRYYKLFYCTVLPAQGRSYSVITRITSQMNAEDRFVSFLDELPFTPTGTMPTPSSNTTNQQIVNQMLNNQIALQIVQNGYKAQNQILWGNDDAPTAADFWLDQVGCADDPWVDTPFKSYGSC